MQLVVVDLKCTFNKTKVIQASLAYAIHKYELMQYRYDTKNNNNNSDTFAD